MKNLIEATDNESGTLTLAFSSGETATAHVSPVPDKAPGLIFFDVGTDKEECVYYETKDDIGGTVSTLTRDIKNQQSGGVAHDNGAPWETLQSAEYLNFLITAMRIAHDDYGNVKLKAPEGFLLNGKLSVTVVSNDLVVAIKTAAGTDPSATDPVYVNIGGSIRIITAALSVTAPDGTGWMNAGSTEFAAKEIDYFAYLGYNATDGVVIGFSRIPYALQYLDFNTTSTNERYAKISTITNAAANDPYVIIGRFAATLSAGAGYIWTVPTFTPRNLVQRPIYESRILTWLPTYSGLSVAPSNARCQYQVRGQRIWHEHQFGGGFGTSNNTSKSITLPFSSPSAVTYFNGQATDNGADGVNPAYVAISGNVASIYKTLAAGSWTASGNWQVSYAGEYYL